MIDITMISVFDTPAKGSRSLYRISAPVDGGRLHVLRSPSSVMSNRSMLVYIIYFTVLRPDISKLESIIALKSESLIQSTSVLASNHDFFKRLLDVRRSRDSAYLDDNDWSLCA